MLRVRYVLAELVVQRKEPVVAALHDEDGGEGLRDRSDPILRVVGRHGRHAGLRRPHAREMDWRAISDDQRGDGG
jgi:hypothetical protein